MPQEGIIGELSDLFLQKDPLFACSSAIFTIADTEDNQEEEPSKHLNKAVENYLWGTAEIAVGVAEAVRGDPLGGALLVVEGIRNCKEAWNELQEAIAEKEEKTPRK